MSNGTWCTWIVFNKARNIKVVYDYGDTIGVLIIYIYVLIVALERKGIVIVNHIQYIH